MKKIILILSLNLIFSQIYANDLLECEWKNTQGKPCLIITKTPNNSSFLEKTQIK